MIGASRFDGATLLCSMSFGNKSVATHPMKSSEEDIFVASRHHNEIFNSDITIGNDYYVAY